MEDNFKSLPVLEFKSERNFYSINFPEGWMKVIDNENVNSFHKQSNENVFLQVSSYFKNEIDNKDEIESVLSRTIKDYRNAQIVSFTNQRAVMYSWQDVNEGFFLYSFIFQNGKIRILATLILPDNYEESELDKYFNETVEVLNTLRIN
jgi:hypothetical protein